MSWFEFVYSLALLGMGFVLGWGLHGIKCKNQLKCAEYEISALRRENHKLQIRVSVLKSDITALRTENVAHVQRYKESPEVKEAVKYAMKSAHPDNGGDAKDFMKFRELYNKIK